MALALKVVSHSEEETTALAKKLAPFFRPGDLIVLTGELGAGKTVFVRGLAAALEINEDQVNSPSYTMVNEYPQGKMPLYHLDLYRLGDASELKEIGWNDYRRREGVMVVEWGEKAEQYLPVRYYEIRFQALGEHDRDIEIVYHEE